MVLNTKGEFSERDAAQEIMDKSHIKYIRNAELRFKYDIKDHPMEGEGWIDIFVKKELIFFNQPAIDIGVTLPVYRLPLLIGTYKEEETALVSLRDAAQRTLDISYLPQFVKYGRNKETASISGELNRMPSGSDVKNLVELLPHEVRLVDVKII